VISGTLLREKAARTSRRWALKILKLLMTGSAVSSTDTVFKTIQQWGNGERNSYSKLLRVMNLRTFIMLMRLGCSSAFHLTRHRV
jgi:hypothetical protein